MKGKLHDTHFHLDLHENQQDFIDKIEEAGIYTIAVTNLPVLYTRLHEKINQRYIKVAIGFHPELVCSKYINQLPLLLEIINSARYIGEIGLDFTTNLDNKTLQIEVFSKVVNLCRNKTNKILSIHSRGAAEEVVDIIGPNFKSIPILHWYSGNLTTLNLAIRNNCYFSINYSMISSKKGVKLIKSIPLDRILLESDGPFVKINESTSSPLNIDLTIKKTALVLGINSESLSKVIQNNFRRIIKNTI